MSWGKSWWQQIARRSILLKKDKSNKGDGKRLEPSANGSSSEQNSTTNSSAQEVSAKMQHIILVKPELLWDEAYNGLRDDQPALVKAYEKILSRELNGISTNFQTSEDQSNVIEQKNVEIRRSQMNQLIQNGLKKTERESKVKQGIGNWMQVTLAANDIIKFAVQFCPQAALPWTGVTLALQLFMNPLKETEANRVGIDYSIKKMTWYWNLSCHLLSEDGLNDSYTGLRSELKGRVVDLYKVLLSYQMKSVCSYYQNRGLVILREVIGLDDWDGSLKDVQAAETAVLQDSHVLLEKDIRQEEEDNKCLKDLFLTDPAADMKRIESSKGTLLFDSYMWILSHPNFIDWINGETTQLLWIKGDPGKGKTMLLVGIIKELLKSLPNSSLQSFFFFQGTDTNLDNATAVLRGLLYQMLVQQPCLISYVRKKYDKSGPKLFEGSNVFFSLSGIFTDMLRGSSLSCTYLIVDALDECQTGLEQLLDLIVQSLSDLSPRVKWLVSSRHRVEIEERLRRAKSRVDLDLGQNVEHQVSLAVEAYINHKMSDLVESYRTIYADSQDPVILEQLQKVEDEVARELRRKANGTFLWVALVFKQIEEIHCGADKVLEFVRRMMHQIINRNDDYSQHCRQVLLAMVNTYRPLRLPELITLAAIPKLTPPRIIIRLCGLISIREDDKTVYFVHQSAKDYLIKHEKSKILSEIFPIGYVAGHTTVVSRSIEAMEKILQKDVYNLSHPGFPIAKVKTPHLDPLASIRYACVYWVDHLCEMKSSYNKIGLNDNGTVDNFLRKHFLHWLEALSLVEGISDIYSSALLFSPVRSLTRRLFQKEEPDWITTKPFMEADWGACIQTLYGHSSLISSVALSHDDTQVVSGSNDRTIKIWDARSGTCLKTLEGHSDWVYSVAFSHDSTQIVSCSGDKTVKIWNTSSGACIMTLEGHSNIVCSVQVVSGSGDRTVKIWNTGSGTCIKTLEGHNSVVVSGSSDRTVKIWDTRSGTCLETLEGHSDWVSSVIFSHDSTQLISGSDDKTVKIWDTSVSGSNDRTIKIWDARSGTCLRTLEGHSDWVYSVAFSHDSTQVVSCSGDRTVKIWNTGSGTCLRTLEGHNSIVCSVSFSHDSTQIVSGSENQKVKIWNTSSGACLRTLEGHGSQISSVSFSHDSTQILSGSNDRTVKIWDARSGTCLKTLEGHSGWISSVSFSHDSTQVVSGSDDRTVKIWDARSGTCLKTLNSSGLVYNILFDTTGSYLITDKGTISWDLLPNLNISMASTTLEEPQHHGYAFNTDQSWIMWNGQNVLWLPSDYRSTYSAVASGTIAIGCSSGCVLIINFSSEKPPLNDSY
ncbi:WD40-repeat-containing domain protein [Tricladium varicosporioides]|nr:WD40-repeat-containing domain protein [Hymenoscyphus varicosporioides]